MKKLLEGDWSTLVSSITQGHCILMLGSDAVTTEVEGETVSLMDLFARQLRGELQGLALPDPCHPTQIAQAYQDAEGRNYLNEQVSGFFRRQDEPGPALLSLGALPFRLVITTTPDRLMEKAFGRQAPRKDPYSDAYHPQGPKVELAPEGTVARPLVYHLFGDVENEEDSTFVTAESHLLDFLVAVAAQNPPLPTNLSSVLRDPKTSFLFLGFGLRHWSLRILLHMLQINKQNRSFAWERFDAAEIGAADRANILFLEKGLKINCYDLRLDEFTAELKRRVEEKVKKPGVAGEAQRPFSAPRVFLSYASEDKEQARRLSEKLKARNIETWFDKKDLHAGEDWKQKIDAVLGGETDFCLVLNSQALNQKAKNEAFVNREINCSLDRQKNFRGYQMGFLIPVKIDDFPLDHDLRQLQWVDLTQPEGFDNLVKDLKREFERRNKRG